jgi:glycosyltransferase involved in cell wall biosynthesis
VRLIVDLRFVAGRPAQSPDERSLSLDELVAAARRPWQARHLLRSVAYERVKVERDPLPMTSVQAAMLTMVALLVQSRRIEYQGREATRLALFARALWTLVVAAPRELVMTAVTFRRVRRLVARSIVPPVEAPVNRPTSVVYLRAHPSLRYMGEYVGGAAAHTKGVLNGLVANGLRVELYGPEAFDGIADGVTVRCVPLRALYHIVPWLTFAAYSDELVRAAAGTKADFVYQRLTLGSFAGPELARRLNVPFVLEYNGSEVWSIRNWGSGRLPLDDVLLALERKNTTEASLIVVVSEVLQEELIGFGIEPARILVNPNGVDLNRLEPYRSRSAEQWREKLGREHAATIGFVGTFGLWHGVLELPEIAARVRDKRHDARWILIGDGRLHDQVRARIDELGLGDRIELTGIVRHEHTLELLAACDICISPHIENPDGTRFFGSPTKLFEYMALAKPIVASNLEQIGEVLENERTALLCPPGDPTAAAAAVVRLLDDEKLRGRLGAAALDEVREKYSWDLHVRRILEALASA